MRNQRQHKIDVAIAKCLSFAEPHPLPVSILKADAGRMVVPRPTETELSDSIAYHDAAQRLTSDQGETEVSYKLNQAGRMWLAEQA